MASEKQLLANKANALKSTGPRTDNGKSKSRHNALKHGLTASEIVIPGEDPEIYLEFRERLLSELLPQRALEEDLADRIVTTLWRLRRIPRLENAFFAWSQHKRCWRDTPPSFDIGFDDEARRQSDPALLPRPQASERQQTADQYTAKTWFQLKSKLMGRTVEDACGDANVLTKLSSYETRLLNQLERLWRQLRELQCLRTQPSETSRELSTL